MFTGIIEALGTVVAMDQPQPGNIEYKIMAPFLSELVQGQSVAHNGVCLTVTDILLEEGVYKVTAIEETLRLTNLGALQPGDEVNLERCMPANGRFDGHIVQGHVDDVAVCEEVVELGGSWIFKFSHSVMPGLFTVPKGSVCVNGISLTVVASEKDNFTVAIIPHTYQFTNLKNVKKGLKVNIEFDIIGKYLFKMNQLAN